MLSLGTQGQWNPLSCHAQELMIQGRAGGIFFPAFWKTRDLRQAVLCRVLPGGQALAGYVISITLDPQAAEVGVPGPILQLRKLRLGEAKWSQS